MARIAGILAIFIGLIAEKAQIVPPILFGCLAYAAVALTTMLPETGGLPLPKNLEDIKDRHKLDEENSCFRQTKRLANRICKNKYRV
jgi:hypothetical protein